MPKTRHTPKQMTNVIGNGTPLTLILTRPVTLDCARRLEAHRFQLFALNESGKTLQDAADAIGLTKETVRNYIEALGIDWKNLIRKPRKANNLPK